MPQIRHYEIEITLRLAVDGTLAYHEAVKVAEDRAAKALQGDVPSHSDPVSSARVISVAAVDATARPSHAGGHR